MKRYLLVIILIWIGCEEATTNENERNDDLPNVAPTWVNIPDITLFKDSLFRFTVTAVDSNQDSIRYTSNTVPS